MSNKAKGVILGVLGQLQKSISFDECNRNKTFYDGVKRGIKLSKKAIENIKTENLSNTQKENKQILNNEKLIENINIEEIKQETLFDIFKFGDDIPEWMIEDKNITLQEYTYYPPVITINSDEDFYKINNVGVNSTLKEVKEAMKEYTEFYSIHTPDIPNTGWYYLSDKGDIIIFDFIEDDLSYVSENVTPESKVISVSLSNLIFFD